MSFQEKSSWIMLAILVILGTVYFYLVGAMSSQGHLAVPNIPILILFTIGIIVFATIGHLFIALHSPKDANEKLDERDKQIAYRSSYFSGGLFGFLVITSLILYLLFRSGEILFYTIFASLIISQLFEYTIKIYLYRRAFV